MDPKHDLKTWTLKHVRAIPVLGGTSLASPATHSASSSLTERCCLKTKNYASGRGRQLKSTSGLHMCSQVCTLAHMCAQIHTYAHTKIYPMNIPINQLNEQSRKIKHPCKDTHKNPHHIPHPAIQTPQHT